MIMEDVEKWGLLGMLVGMLDGVATLESILAISQKVQ